MYYIIVEARDICGREMLEDMKKGGSKEKIGERKEKKNRDKREYVKTFISVQIQQVGI